MLPSHSVPNCPLTQLFCSLPASSSPHRLVACEELAKSSKRGVHSSKDPAANRVNDVSTPGSATRAKQYLPFFQRAGGPRVKRRRGRDGLTCGRFSMRSTFALEVVKSV